MSTKFNCKKIVFLSLSLVFTLFIWMSYFLKQDSVEIMSDKQNKALPEKPTASQLGKSYHREVIMPTMDDLFEPFDQAEFDAPGVAQRLPLLLEGMNKLELDAAFFQESKTLLAENPDWSVVIIGSEYEAASPQKRLKLLQILNNFGLDSEDAIDLLIKVANQDLNTIDNEDEKSGFSIDDEQLNIQMEAIEGLRQRASNGSILAFDALIDIVQFHPAQTLGTFALSAYLSLASSNNETTEELLAKNAWVLIDNPEVESNADILVEENGIRPESDSAFSTMSQPHDITL